MPWNVTLEVSRCDAATTFLGGVFISSGTLALGQTDANGRFILVIEDVWDFVILTMKKSGFVNKNLTVTKSVDNGKTIKDCLAEAPPSEPTGTGEPISCFIVTATTGSAASFEVQSLRRLRDRVGVSSKLGAKLIDAIYKEYAQFSPQIAEKLRQDEMSREAVLQIVVRPLFAWYTLAGKLALEHADTQESSRLADEILSSCGSDSSGMSLVRLLETIRNGEKLPVDSPQVLRDLAPVIARLSFANWAILDPLIRVWRAAAEQRDLIHEVAEWLGDAPIDALCTTCEAITFEAEIVVLADFFAFRPEMRRRLGERLMVAWPSMAGALARHGFGAEVLPMGKEQ